MANEAKIEAAAAVLEAMGGEAVAVETPTEEAKVTKTKKAIKKVKAAVVKVKKEKKPEAPTRPGPKTMPVNFPTNTKHKTADGGEIEIVKTRISYLIKLPGGRLKWFSALKVQAMTESKAAIASEHEEAEGATVEAAA